MLNLFGGKKKQAQTVIKELVSQLLEGGAFSLSFQIEKEKEKENSFKLDIFGEDEGLLKTKDGRFLSALQTYLNRVVRHNFEEQAVFIRLDSGHFFEDKEQRLLDLADKLKQKALSTGRPVYLKKSLSPFQRRKVHQFLTEGGAVKTSSVGEGFYKNICITPTSSKGSF